MRLFQIEKVNEQFRGSIADIQPSRSEVVAVRGNLGKEGLTDGDSPEVPIPI